jgi:hypothetical protein
MTYTSRCKGVTLGAWLIAVLVCASFEAHAGGPLSNPLDLHSCGDPNKYLVMTSPTGIFAGAGSHSECVKACKLAVSECVVAVKGVIACYLKILAVTAALAEKNCVVNFADPAARKQCKKVVSTGHRADLASFKLEGTGNALTCTDIWGPECEATCTP